MFDALVLNKDKDQKATGKVEKLDIADLPEGDVLVNIDYSTLNYKDSLALTSSSPIVKNFPMIPGIDFSGVVEETSNNSFKIGDKVVLNGYGVGEKHWGGMAQKARVLTSLPATCSEQWADRCHSRRRREWRRTAARSLQSTS